MSWTDDRVDILRKLWAEGLSASQIAAELGGVSRNAVIGKVHRLGLSGRARGGSSSTTRQKRTANRSAGYAKASSRSAGGQSRGVASRAGQVVARPEPVPDIPEPTPLMIDLMALNDQVCRFPIGDPQDGENFGFCGHPVKESQPYCAYHCMLTFQPPAERRRDRAVNQRPRVSSMALRR